MLLHTSHLWQAAYCLRICSAFVSVFFSLPSKSGVSQSIECYFRHNSVIKLSLWPIGIGFSSLRCANEREYRFGQYPEIIYLMDSCLQLAVYTRTQLDERESRNVWKLWTVFRWQEANETLSAQPSQASFNICCWLILFSIFYALSLQHTCTNHISIPHARSVYRSYRPKNVVCRCCAVFYFKLCSICEFRLFGMFCVLV